MNKVLRCTMLSALFVTGLVASVLAAPYQPPTAVSTPAVDQAIIASYSGAVHGANVRLMRLSLKLFLHGDLTLL